MALLTENKVNQFGVIEEYWRILAINLNAQYKYCDITVGAYATQEARESMAEPMNVKKIRAKWSEDEYEKFFSPQALDLANGNIYEQAYEYIKYKDEVLSTALDI